MQSEELECDKVHLDKLLLDKRRKAVSYENTYLTQQVLNGERAGKVQMEGGRLLKETSSSHAFLPLPHLCLQCILRLHYHVPYP